MQQRTENQVRGYTHITKVGRFTVTDGSTIVLPNEDGEIELTLDQLAGFERRAAKTVLLDAGQVNGAELKFARKAMGLRQQDLAQLLDCSVGTVSRWENDQEPIGKPIQLAVAQLVELVLRHGDNALQVVLGGSDTDTELHVRAS